MLFFCLFKQYKTLPDDWSPGLCGGEEVQGWWEHAVQR